MKKLSAIFLAMSLVVPAMAGSIFNNMNTYGEIQTIGALIENANNAPSKRDVSNRVIFGLGFDLIEDAKTNITFANTEYWGRSSTGESIDYYLNNITVAEANVVLSNIFGNWELKIGRQFYGEEGDTPLYFGPTHYRPSIQSFLSPVPLYATVPSFSSIDAAVAKYNSDKLSLTILYAKESETFSTSDTDISYMGTDIKAALTESVLLRGYFFDFRDGSRASGEQHLGIWGVKPSFDNGLLSASAEFAKNYYFGDILGQNNAGWMIKADAKANINTDVADISPRALYLHAEKSFFAMGNFLPGLLFSNSYPYFHRTGRGRRVLNAGVDLKPAALEKWSFSFDYFAFSLSNKSNPAWFGNEFDIVAKYALNEYVELHAGAGYMTNVIDTFDYNNKNPYTGQLGMIVKF